MRLREGALWAGLCAALLIPLALSATSPYLAYREAVYIASGFAGVIALSLCLLQPLLAAGDLAGLSRAQARHLHRWSGALMLSAVLGHVVGLWLTSPPDVVDALTFRSPTPFSIWGVLAMWAVFATALLAAQWRRLGLSPRLWRRAHTGLAVVIAGGGVLHAVLIEGTMEPVSKLLLCGLVLLATARAVWGAWRPRAG